MDGESIKQHEAVLTTQKLKSSLKNLLKVETLLHSELTDSPLYKKIWIERSNYYTKNAPHLLKLNERAQEAKLDQRGIIFAILNKNNILASLRLINRPFEIESYQVNDFDFNQYNNYFEIGRLVTNPKLDQITIAIIVQYLLCITGLETFTGNDCRGLVAICKPSTLKFFCKFGLKPQGRAYSKTRDINYHIITGNLESILKATEKIIFNQEKIHKRLLHSLGASL